MLRLGEERRVVDGDRHRAAGPQRAGVERRVQHVGADLLGEQRQAGLLPGEPRRPVGDGGGRGDDLGGRQHPARSAPRRCAAPTTASSTPDPITLPSAPSSPSTYLPTPPRSAGTLVASTSTRGGRPAVTGRLLDCGCGTTLCCKPTLRQAYADAAPSPAVVGTTRPVSSAAMPDDIARVLAGAVRRDPTRPLLTWYDDATGERTELSGATLANWVAKTANLLVDGVGLGPGDRAGVLLPPHWQTAARAARLLVGRRRGGRRLGAGGRALRRRRPGRRRRRPPASASCSRCTRSPLPMPAVPAGWQDYNLEVRAYGDHFAAGVPPRACEGDRGRPRPGRPGPGRRGRATRTRGSGSSPRSPPAPASCSAATSTRSKLADRVAAEQVTASRL